MYIDHPIISGVNPLKEFIVTDANGHGLFGQLAVKHESNEDYAHLQSNPDFSAMIDNLYNADKAVLAAEKLIQVTDEVKSDGVKEKRLSVGKAGEPGDFARLGKDETAFFKYLAQARVNLVSASLKCIKATSEETPRLKKELIHSIEWQLHKLRDKIHAIHPQALIKIESLAQEIAPKQFSFATDALRSYDKGVITECLKKKFPNYSDDIHSPVVEKIEQILRTQTAAFFKAKRKRGSPDLSPAAKYLKEQFPGFEDQDYSEVIKKITDTLRGEGKDVAIGR